MNSFLRACISANEEIAQTLKDGYPDFSYIKSSVGAGGDVSSGLDLWAEKIFVSHLGEFGRIESEESGEIGTGIDTIVIDPIDGSSNALSHFPYFGSSVARINADGMLDKAVVCNLSTHDIFIKEAGMSVLQGKLFKSSFCPRTVAPNAHIGIFEKAYAHPALVEKIKELGLKFRAPGAVALSLAYAHNVSFFLFVGDYRIYDFVAGIALCEGLEVIVEEDYVIVSKDKVLIKILENLVQKYVREVRA